MFSKFYCDHPALATTSPIIQQYLSVPRLLFFSQLLLYLPYAKDSFPVSIMATPYALVSTLLPPSYALVI